VATPQALLTHAPEQITPDLLVGVRTRRTGRVRAGLLIGATTALAVTALPGTAAAVPGKATTAADAAAKAAAASHQLEVVSEQVNEARVALQRQQSAADDAERAAAAAQKRLDAFDAQIRQLARSAYTSEGFSSLDVMLTSGSADEFVHQMGTLDAIAGRTNDLVLQVGLAADKAKSAQVAADEAEVKAKKTYDGIAAQQKDLQAQIADFQAQYAALSKPQRQAVSRAHAGTAQPVPTSVAAPSGAAQVAVNTALAQVGDPYVWGAGGPDAFDCSGLMQYAYSAAGISLPHSSSSQSQMGTAVSRDQLKPGDLVFFYSPVSHVGMYIGNGQMVHAATSGTPVQVVSLDSLGSYNSARRLTGG
jgi:cell wall-associated NlpC family hydrolase